MDLEGKITSGFGKATYTIFLQRQGFVKRELPFAAELKSGTINLDISPLQYQILNFDHLFEDMPWGEDRLETFGFITLNTMTHEGTEYEKHGYIYVPHKSKHFDKRSQMEIVAKEIPNVGYDQTLSLSLDEGKIELYTE